MTPGLSTSAQTCEQLQQTIQLLRTVVEVTSDALFVKSISGRYLFCNTAGAELIGRTVEQIVGRNDIEIFGEDIAASIRASDRRIIDTGEGEVEEQTIVVDESPRVFETTKTVYRGGDQTVLGIMGIARDVTARRAAETFSLRQQKVLERIAHGDPLGDVLNELVDIIEGSVPGAMGSCLLLDRKSQTLHVASGRSLPGAYNAAIEGAAVGPREGSCGTAAFRGESVRVDDIQSDPLWHKYASLANQFGLRSCWATPILARKDGRKTVLGTFAVYARHAGVLNDRLQDILMRIEYLACIAIESDLHRQQLAASEARLRTFVENTPDAVLLHGEGGIIIDVNHQTCVRLGYSREELIGAYPTLFDVGADDQVLIRINEHISRREPFAFESRHRCKDGREFPVEIRLTPFEQGGTLHAISSVRDLTVQKQTQERLQRERTLLEQSQRLARIGSFERDLKANTVIWSDELFRLFGYPPGTIQPTLDFFLSHIHPDDRLRVQKTLQTAFARRSSAQIEARFIRADGAERVLESQGTVVTDEQGKPVRVIGACQDITERKQAETALRDSEERYRSLISALAEGVTLHADDGAILACNASAERILGLSRDQIRGRKSLERDWKTVREDGSSFPGEELPANITLRTGAACSNVIMGIQQSDGQRTWISVNSEPLIRFGEARPFGVVCSFADITERKRSADSLRESEARLRVALQAASAVAFVWDIRADTITRYYGTEPALPSNLKTPQGVNEVHALVHPDDKAAFDAGLEACLVRGAEYHNSFRVIRPDGSTRWLEEWGTLERTPEGAPQRLTGIAIDITERKQAELALQQSVSRLTATLESTADGILVVDLEGRFVDFNQQFLQVWRMPPELIQAGRKDDLLTTLNTNEAMQHTLAQLKDPRAFVHRAKAIYADPEATSFDVLEFRDGRIVERISHPQRIHGQPVGRVWSFRDVTAQKHAEREQQKLVTLIQHSRDFIVLADMDGLVTFMSKGARRMIGIDPEVNVERFDPLDYIHPDSREFAINVAFPQTYEDGYWEGEMQLLHQQTGVSIDTWRSLFLIKDDDGVPVCFASVTRDITEQKRTEAAIRESEQRFRSVLDYCPAHIFLKDLSGRYLFVNRGMADAMNRPQLDWIGLAARDIFPTELSQRFEQNDARVLKTLQPIQLEESALRADGNRAELLTILFPLFRSDGKPYALCGIATDITDYKRAEAELRRTAALLQAVADGTTEAVFVKDREGKYLLFNEAASRFVGKPVSEVLGQDDTALFDAEGAQFIMRRDRRVMELGVTETEEETVTAAGVTRTYLATKGPYRDATGQIVGVIGLSLDISDRKETERALRLTQFSVDRAVDAVFWIAPESEILYANEAAHRMLGYDWGELIGVTVPEIDPNFPPEVWTVHWQEIKSRKSFSFESERVTRDGRYLLTEVTVNYLQYEGREYNCAVMRDITQRKRTEAERDRLWNQSPDLLCTSGFDGRYHQLNPAWTRTLGWSVTEILDSSWTDLVHPDDQEATVNALELLNRNQPIMAFINRFRMKDGGYRWFSWNAIPVFATGTIYGFARDITEERLLAEQVRQSQKMEAIGRLAGGVAHDFNNLLTVINSYAELLLADVSLKDEQRESVAEILTAGGRAAELTAQLLAFSRKSTISLKQINLNAAIESSSRMLRRVLGEGIDLRVVCDPGLPLIKGDQGQLEQALINLALNARDAMPQGGRLTISSLRIQRTPLQMALDREIPAGDYSCVQVMDSGEGMTEEIMHKIFEPFFTTKDIGKGTGLGLAVVHGIVSQFGGYIRVDSAIGMGTTVTLMFPAIMDPAAADFPVLCPPPLRYR